MLDLTHSSPYVPLEAKESLLQLNYHLSEQNSMKQSSISYCKAMVTGVLSIWTIKYEFWQTLVPSVVVWDNQILVDWYEH